MNISSGNASFGGVSGANMVSSNASLADTKRARPVSELRDFASVLTTDERGPLGKRDTDPVTEARDTAERFIASALVAPVLKELRETSQAAEPFAPTQGERQFRSMLDAQVALNVVRGAQFPLVDRLAQDLLRHGRAEGQALGQAGAQSVSPARTQAASPGKVG